MHPSSESIFHLNSALFVCFFFFDFFLSIFLKKFHHLILDLFFIELSNFHDMDHKFDGLI